MYEFMIFIWIIGYMVGLGIDFRLYYSSEAKLFPGSFFMNLLFWPITIGMAINSK